MTDGDAGIYTPPAYLPPMLELTLFVRDVDKSADYYRALGVKLFDNDYPGRPHHVDGYIGRDAGFGLFPAGTKPVTRAQLGLYVADRATVAANLDRLNVSYELPMIRRLTTRDPDGNYVHLTEARKRNQH